MQALMAYPLYHLTSQHADDLSQQLCSIHQNVRALELVCTPDVWKAAGWLNVFIAYMMIHSRQIQRLCI
jgi:hypothetical protein